MSLTYRSTVAEMYIIRHIDADGDERMVVMTRNPGTDNWQSELIHPSQVWTETYQGLYPVQAGANWIDSKHNEFVSAKRQQHQKPVELDPLRGSVGVPTSPVLSMATNTRSGK